MHLFFLSSETQFRAKKSHDNEERSGVGWGQMSAVIPFLGCEPSRTAQFARSGEGDVQNVYVPGLGNVVTGQLTESPEGPGCRFLPLGSGSEAWCKTTCMAEILSARQLLQGPLPTLSWPLHMEPAVAPVLVMLFERNRTRFPERKHGFWCGYVHTY